ncbi:hypothetical protein ACFQES_08325 [Nonomuraea salmonea]|uniref:hypothetical protein n=1 Tax=Nonomuraea salmonea TaxID=46181 RepID=UPI00361FB7E0
MLAGELAAHGGDHTRAYPAYEAEIAPYVLQSRTFAVGAAKRLVPAGRFDLWTLARAANLINLLPTAVTRAAAKLGGKSARLHESVALKEYAPAEGQASTP